MLKISVLILTLALSGATESAAGQPPSPTAPRVFVFTTESQAGAPPTEEAQGRLDSVRDVREALAKKAGIVLVPTAAEAQVLVEVVGREKRDAPIGGFGGTTVTPQGEMIVRLHLKYGEHEADLKGVAPGYWARAAKDAADRALKWIARIDNIPGKRGDDQASTSTRRPSTSEGSRSGRSDARSDQGHAYSKAPTAMYWPE